MGHSFVEFRGAAEQFHDLELVTVMHLLMDTLQHTSPVDQPTAAVVDLVASNTSEREYYGPGCQDIELDEFITSADDAQSLLYLIMRCRQGLGKFQDVIPAGYLNALVNSPGVLEFEDRPVSEVDATLARMEVFIRKQLEESRQK